LEKIEISAILSLKKLLICSLLMFRTDSNWRNTWSCSWARAVLRLTREIIMVGIRPETRKLRISNMRMETSRTIIKKS